MPYYFYVVCPKCNKESVVWTEQRTPEPTVSCGDCLMDHVEMVQMKVVKVRETD